MAATKIDAHRIISFANSMIQCLNVHNDIAMAVHMTLTLNEEAKRTERTTKGEVAFVLETLDTACRIVAGQPDIAGLKPRFEGGRGYADALNEEMGKGFFEIFCETYITFQVRMHGAEFAGKLIDVLNAFRGEDHAGRVAAMRKLEKAA